MIELIIELLYPLTIVLSLLLLSHSVILTKLGAKQTYYFWSIVPLALLLYSCRLSWFNTSDQGEPLITTYLVAPKQVLQQGASLDWLMLIWLVGSLIIVGHALLSYWRFQQNLQCTQVKELAQIKLPNSLSLYQSTHAHSPMLIGLFKQKLLIPEDFNFLYNQEQQALILEHEICHFDRNDIYWNLLAYSFIALFWFHPLVWLAYFRFRRDQEISCDQTVLARKQTESRINYSKALLVAAETSPPLAFAQLSFKKYGAKNIMFERIKHIKINNTYNGFSLAFVSLLSVSLLTGISYAGNLSAGQKVHANKKVALQPVVRIEPKYPIEAAKQGVEGSVVLKYNVDKSGKVADVIVLKSVPEKVFDKSAKIALRQWKYDSGGVFHKDLLVQLDFVMSEDSVLPSRDLLEKIKVSNH